MTWQEGGREIFGGGRIVTVINITKAREQSVTVESGNVESILREELQATRLFVFFVTSNAAESESAVRAAVVRVVAAYVAKVAWRERRS